MDRLIHDCIKILDLKNPVEVRFVSKLKNRNWDAYYIAHTRKGKVCKHIIRVSLQATFDSVRDIETIIAHEFVHAWQEENNGYADGFHGNIFQKKAKYLREQLMAINHVISSNIFDAEIDVD